ncbi:MAG: DUF3883 domain-containing protein [Sulfurospirillaceae bacterium]|nr:DUF3883 domain-containing protein [Sulfurospirillaceae bacterium]MDD2826515.1 DUF3883 domain-containing protein [Sulfurospirillaceae bacterium]
MSSFEVDYDEELIPRIRDLIDGYDKDSILKEYLQNADDSGATELIVTFDKQQYPKLNSTDFEAANTNALLLQNNSQFKEKDFKSIVKISAQGKTKEADSTGRFGQGFSSSFSISDHPSFVSNGRAYWFDVQRTAVGKEKSKSIQGWDYTSSQEISEWLDTFNNVIDENFEKTIFRLPLRDEITSKESQISNEIFTFEDFLKWVDAWQDNVDNLLFLRHVHRLILQEISEDGKKTVHLDIKTENKDELEKYNNIIQKEFKGSPIEICERWESHGNELPLFTYKHHFEINYFDRNKAQYSHEKKKFTVINGLLRGDNNSLIQQAKKVLKITPNPRKVLPWVGVAVEIDDKNQPIKNESKFFTFLPLPIKSNYPVHIHGWFDLNPKRTEITSSGSGDDKETLVHWNELLLEEGVSKAWALLIDYLKIEQNSHYNFWAKETEFSLNDKLVKGFYKHISELKCFYTAFEEKKEWLSPKEIDLHYFKDEKNEILLNAFEKHFSIILPKPQKYIIDNFANIDIELTEITSDYIRGYLSTESKIIEFPVSIDKMPIAILRKKEWFFEILKYCANNGEDYNLLDGLPFELTLNRSIYKIGSDTLFDKNPNLTLFQDMKHLFLDTELVGSIKKHDTLPSSWLQPTLQNQLSLLLEYWKHLTLSKEWIKEVIDLIVHANSEEYNEAEDEIKKFQIIYQENGEYGKIQSDIKNYSPYMPRDEDLENNLIYLEEIKMNIVHHYYIEIYKPLLKYEGLITQLTSATLIQHLLLLDSFEFFQKKEAREYLIDILAEDISWFENLSQYEKLTLNSIPFVETVTDNIYNKNTDAKLFLPTNFTPPKHIKSLEGEYEIISVEVTSNLYELYRKMGFTEQNIDSYIQDIIIPFLKNSDDTNDKIETLKWLAIEWNKIKEAIEDNTFSRLKNANIIPSFLNIENLYKASELYMPTIELPNILSDNRYKPICFEDEKTQESWVVFLKDLGASPLILAQHIEDRVKQIIEKNSKKDAILLLNYIANNFEIFEQLNILDTLAKYAWYPVEEAEDLLKPKYAYTELKKADELILYDDLKIAGGYYHILDRSVRLGKKDEKSSLSEKEMATKLGLITHIPNESFFESFRKLIKLSPTNGQVVNYTKEIYKYIGRRFKDETIDFDIEEKTILINNQWIAPKYVYQVEIHLTDIYSWSSLVGDDKESNLAKGLILLGVQEKPTFYFLIELLKRLPQEQDLNSNQLKDARALLTEIQKEDENLINDQLPILTVDNQLILSSKLYINDLPAYKKATDKNKNLKFCQNQFEKLAKRLEVTSLTENYTSAIYDYVECESSHEIVNILKNDSFKEAILRLLYHEKKIKENEINESILHDVLPSNLTFVSKLVIEFSIEKNFLFKSDETTYEGDGKLYILEHNNEDDMIEIIAKYICDTKNLSRDSYGWIERILRNKMSKEEIHDFLNNKKVIDLPQEFDIDDTVSLFSNPNTEQFDEETIYDTPMNQEENHEQLNIKSKGEIAPPIKPKSTSENISAKNHSVKHRESSSSTYFGTSSSNTTNKKIISSNDRKPVYVGKDKELDEAQEISQRESAKEIGDKGENYILVHKETLLLSKDNDFQKTPTNNKGFDIYEKDTNGQIIRYIEVKTLTGQWAQGGVGITKDQLEFAQKEKDKWWLFVVENINTDNTKVYQFKNPILEANRFMFDSSWKQLTYQSKKIENQEPKIDDKYEVEIVGLITTCVITNVQPRGVFFQVDLILETGKEIKNKKFNKSWKKIDG